MNRKYLASTRMKTPDSRQLHPPKGELISMQWKIPLEVWEQEPVLELTILFWNYTEQVITLPLPTRVGCHSHFVIGDEFLQTGGILTYRGRILLPDGTPYREWRQQLWVQLIPLDQV